MGAISRRVILLALLTLAWAPSACSRRQAAEPPAAAAPGPEAPVSTGPQRAGSAGDEPAAADGGAEVRPSREILLRREETSQPAAPGTPATPLELEQQALLALPSSPVLPEDFRIGGLADLLQSDNPARGVSSAARGFLEALVRGEVDSALIEPGRREELTRSLAYHLSAGGRPTAYRIGAVQLDAADPDRAWLNLRLFGSPGRTEGELYLRGGSQRWYVLDLQTQLAALRQPYARAEDRYYPSVYAWGLQ